MPPRLSKNPNVLIGAPRPRTKGCMTARIMLDAIPLRNVLAVTVCRLRPSWGVFVGITTSQRDLICLRPRDTEN
jgi:hypothetical protein